MKRVATLLLITSAGCGAPAVLEDDPGTGTGTLRVEAEYLAWRYEWATQVFVDGAGAEGPGQAPVVDATVILCGGKKRSQGCNPTVEMTPELIDRPGEYLFRMQSWEMVSGGTVAETPPMGLRISVESARGELEGAIRGIDRLDLVAPVASGRTHTASVGAEIAVAWTWDEALDGDPPQQLTLTTRTDEAGEAGIVTFAELDPAATSGTVAAPSTPGTYRVVVEARRGLALAGGLPGSVVRVWRRDEFALEVTP